MSNILIIGGGIGGLSAAIALRKVGYDVSVFEQAPELREAGAGVGIWSNAMHSLDALGAADAILKTCVPLRKLAGANHRGKTLSALNLDDLGEEFRDASCHIVLRPVLLAALAAQVPAGCIHTAHRVIAVELLPHAVRVTFDDKSIREADLVIAADGMFSVARSAVVGDDPIRYSGQTCFRGIAHFPVPEPDTLREVQGRGKRAAVCPVHAQTAYWWAALNLPPNSVLPVSRRQAFLLDTFKGWPFGIPDAIAATPPDSILQNDLIDRAPVKQYAKGRLVLVGDAAHPTTPNLGQGANMAIDDAIVLARALHQSATLDEALRQFEQTRVPRTRLIVQRSWNFGRIARWSSPPAVALRETLLRLTPRNTMKNVLRWQILENVGDLPN